MDFYTYLWLRRDGSPYYAGKGSNDRAFQKHNGFYPSKDRSRILIFPMLNEAEAFESEVAFIDLFGRIDLGTGCLRNRTNGGEGGISGIIFSEETLRKRSLALKGIERTAAWRLHLSESKMGNQARLGQTCSEDQRRKTSAKLMGHGFSLESIQKMKRSRKGKPWSKKRRETYENKFRPHSIAGE